MNLSNVLVLFSGIFTGSILTHALSTEEFGAIKYVLWVVAFGTQFMEFGVFTAGAKVLAETTKEKLQLYKSELIKYLFWMYLISGVLLSNIALLFDWSVLQLGNLSVFLLFMVYSIVFFEFPVLYIFKGSNDVKGITYYKMIKPASNLILLGVAVLVSYPISVHFVLMIYAIGFLSSLIFVLVREVKSSIFKLDKKIIYLIKDEVKNYGFKAFLGRVIGQGVSQLDTFFIKRYLNFSGVGIYQLGMSVIVYPIQAVFMNFGFLMFRRIHTFSKKKFLKVLGLTYFLTAILMLLVYFALPKIFGLLFGEDFMEVLDYLGWFLISTFFVSNNQLLYSYMGVKGMGQSIFNNSVISVLINMLGNLFLIKYYGILGAILASTFTLTFSHLYCLKEVIKDLYFRENNPQ